MKDAIKAKIKAKHPKLSDARIEAMALKLESKVKEEKEIDEKITDLDEIMDFASIIKQDAKIVKLEAEKKEAAKKKPLEKADDDDEDEEDEVVIPGKKTARVPAYVKQMMEKFDAISTKLATFESEKSQTTIKQKASEKLKDIPASYWGEWTLPEKEDDLDAFAEKVTKGFEGFTQDLKTQGYSTATIPKGGSGGPADKKASEAEIKSILAKL